MLLLPSNGSLQPKLPTDTQSAQVITSLQNVNQPTAPPLCSRCAKGPHSSHLCRSKYKNGNPLPLLTFPQPQENWQRGHPQALAQITRTPQNTNNPFRQNVIYQSFLEQPQSVHNWTSVPPPQKC